MVIGRILTLRGFPLFHGEESTGLVENVGERLAYGQRRVLPYLS